MSTAVKTNKASNAMKLPTKTRINLAKRESRKKDMITLGVGIVLIAGLSAAVAKFAVIDQLDRLSQAEGAYNAVHVQYVAMQQAVADYPNVEERYRTYSRSWMLSGDTNGLARVDRADVLDLVEARLLPYGRINTLSLRDSVMVVSMSGMNLSQISAMFERLQTEKIVASASLNMASTEEKDDPNALLDFTITIALQPEQEEAK
jgi:hypothetical protein|uniref:hypothetical protein n=1 Tax=Faecousia sp. TaxID=2952921 RepID=UPI004028DB74